eukprot:CAMPEP_0194042940 /NCGR_PEP_ID=MMETSP0009_2-20130614/14657_1 /TAXON_ID=210454 /ORGANISM="Grammatophora oceanica, Strain CCMP 410" /LENGTH=199 /DNA_ID=CAMNT_0038686981 /DNA_START=72 /DNA_END=671 /DNA_ORIENTATION=-
MYSGKTLVLFLNTILALACSVCCTLALWWPFQGLAEQWIWANPPPYTWYTHIHMAWFWVGCVGLCFLNGNALFLFEESTTSDEAYTVIFNTNTVMHGLWGLFNSHFAYRNAFTKHDKGTSAEWRNGIFFPFFSVLGCCGSAVVRNLYTSFYGVNDVVIRVTWVWEWLSLVFELGDLIYFVIVDHPAKAQQKARGAYQEI